MNLNQFKKTSIEELYWQDFVTNNHSAQGLLKDIASFNLKEKSVKIGRNLTQDEHNLLKFLGYTEIIENDKETIISIVTDGEPSEADDTGW